jgi:adenosine deaminase
LSVRQVIEAVLAGLGAGPLRAVAIVCAMRQHSVEDNVKLAREAGTFAGRGVVGFDLAGDEIRYPAVPQQPAFAAARAAGLHLTCHAGEAGDPKNVEDALALGVERIAHGVIGAREPRIVERVRAEGVVLDMCPTANWKCKAVRSPAEHPLPRLVRAGVRCTISTDSRTVADTTLTREFELVAAMGMTEDEVLGCNRTAYGSKFDAPT